MNGLIATFFLAMAVTVPESGKPPPGMGSFRADYSVTLYGLPIAWSRFDSYVGGGAFKVDGYLSSSGIARIFDSTDATMVVAGSFAGSGVRPQAYNLNYTTGGKKKRTELGFTRGDVTRTVNQPELKIRRNEVPLEPGHLKAVTDPISWMLVPAASAAEVCGRTAKVFDGQTRVDLQMSPAGTVKVSTQGFKGEAVNCRVRFVPVAGYRRNNSSIKYLAGKSRIDIAFAEIGDTGVYAPVQASVTTQIGTVSIRATRFGEVKAN